MRSRTLACGAQHAPAAVGEGWGGEGTGRAGPTGLLCEAGGWAGPGRGDGRGTGRLSSGLLSRRVVGSCSLACCPAMDGELPPGDPLDFCSS